jgi:Caspase domain
MSKAAVRLSRNCVVAALTLAALTISIVAKPGNTSKGIALVVGNDAYTKGPLPNAPNDARDIAGALSDLGFDVDLKLNLDLPQFTTAVQTFGNNVRSNGKTAVFYFSGHGIQVNGENYLLPVDVVSLTPADVAAKTVALQTIFNSLGARAAPNLLIVDACRNNPFASGPADMWVKGLAVPTNPPPNSLIAFSTSPGSVAADGEGTHSPYARALLKYIRKPGQNVNDMFSSIRTDVEANTDGVQVPWENTSLTSELMLRDPVYIKGRFLSADDDALLTINGQQVLDWNQDGSNEKQIRLEAGTNDAVVKVYNQRSYTGGIQGLGGHLPEGWNYTLQLSHTDGSPLIPQLHALEDRPQDNGPHHGKLFTVATMKIEVDEVSGTIRVSALDPDVWQH